MYEGEDYPKECDWCGAGNMVETVKNIMAARGNREKPSFRAIKAIINKMKVEVEGGRASFQIVLASKLDQHSAYLSPVSVQLSRGKRHMSILFCTWHKIWNLVCLTRHN